jgi:hypothetical protein
VLQAVPQGTDCVTSGCESWLNSDRGVPAFNPERSHLMTQIKSRHTIFRFSQNRVVDPLSGLLSIHDPRMPDRVHREREVSSWRP